MRVRQHLLLETKLKAAIFIISGNFALVVGTSLLLTYTGRGDYLLILALSTAATILIGTGVKPSVWGRYLYRSGWMTPMFLTGGGVVLAAEVSILIIFFQGVAPALYTVTTLIAGSLMLFGSDGLTQIEVKRNQPTGLIREERLVIERLTI